MKVLEKNSFFKDIGVYDENILKKEFNILKYAVNDSGCLLSKYNEYRENHTYLSERFLKEFKALNEQHYEMRVSLKSIKLDLDDEKTKDLLKTSEEEVLKSIKNTFQTIVDKKERILNTYKFLERITYQCIYKKEEFVS